MNLLLWSRPNRLSCCAKDSFRRLIDAPRLSTSSSALGAASTSRSRLVVQSKPCVRCPLSQPQMIQRSHLRKNTTEVVSKPAFKPRNIKKAEDAKNHDKISQDKSTNLNACIIYLSLFQTRCDILSLQANNNVNVSTISLIALHVWNIHPPARTVALEGSRFGPATAGKREGRAAVYKRCR